MAWCPGVLGVQRPILGRLTPAAMATKRTLDSGKDPVEWLYEQGYSDGFPCVPPTPERVKYMLTGTERSPDEILGECPPTYGCVTVEKVAINAVMAGCSPIHFATVLAGVECMLDPAFGIHGVSATTMGATPCMIVNGPVRHSCEFNYKAGAMGSGTRANAVVGRALKLLLQNVGAAKLGGTESTTLGTPMKYTMCFAEWEERAPRWLPYHVERDCNATASAVTLMAVVSGPHQIVDFYTKDAGELITLMAKSLITCLSNVMPLINDVLLVVSPEHYECLLRGGVTSKKLLREKLWAACNIEFASSIGKIVTNLKPGPVGYVAGAVLGSASRFAAALGVGGFSAIPKFESPDSIHVVVAGGGAGKFSMFMPGFGLGKPPRPTANLSKPVTRQVERPAKQIPKPAPAPSMVEHLVLLDPTSEQVITEFVPAKRNGRLSGTIGLVDISKPGGDTLLSRLGDRLSSTYPGVVIKRYCKPTFSRPAPAELLEIIKETCDYVVSALAD